jgi:hypothetical protein
MIPQLDAALNSREYDALPEPIKAALPQREWLWLSDAEKARLIQDETEPESFDA